jgi:hypothetical protein
MDRAPPGRELPAGVRPLARDHDGDQRHDQVLDRRVDQAVERTTDDDPDGRFELGGAGAAVRSPRWGSVTPGIYATRRADPALSGPVLSLPVG